MKTILVLAALVAVCVAHSLPTDVLKGSVSLEKGSPYYQRYYEHRDEKGNVRIIDVEAEPEPEVFEPDFDTRNPANTVYLLFTRRNRVLSQTLTNANSIQNSNYNPNVGTKFIVHGWLGSRYNDINPTMRTAYLDKSDVNVIVVCWRGLAASLYNTAAAGIPAVGRGIGQFANSLVQASGSNLNRFHLIGFSLGAHAVGNAGRELGGRVARVTGLDPAGPLWNYSSNRLSPNDGIYVEAIHTDGGTGGLGIGSSVANVDFFPNGGSSQPGCLLSLCNHERAWELFASTVTRNHLNGRRCPTSAQVSLNTCTGVSLNMGNDILTKTGTSGMYRVNTGRSYPF